MKTSMTGAICGMTYPSKLLWNAILRQGKRCARSRHSSWMENLPGTRDLLRMGRAMVRFYCHSFAQAPKQTVLDIDDTFDPLHGHQQLRLFNA